MIELNKEDQALHDIFHGEEKPLHPDTVHITLGQPSKPRMNNKPCKEANVAQKPTEAPKEGEWNPIKPDANWLDKLKSCAMWAVGFGGLCMLLFYWEQAGLMAESIAVPSIAVCASLAGFGIGKSTIGRVR